jgi:hypothetical protein
MILPVSLRLRTTESLSEKIRVNSPMSVKNVTLSHYRDRWGLAMFDGQPMAG